MNTSIEFSNLSVPVKELPDFSKAKLVPIAKKYQYVLWFNFLLLVFFFVGLITGFYFFIEEFPRIILKIASALFLVILLFTAIETFKGFPKRKFGVRELDIIFQKGFFFFKETVIPFKRIQHVEIKQGPILRLLNLYSLKLFTAGASSGDLVINGLDLQTAEKLKAKVLQVSEDKDE
ncbi:PH domain-containing protein [Psychroflexus salis]|uniref:YdbS-like PH domain-containing protein n=1 Tax=Psychroflexus salis TaxID=1526574 RepID=A0A916ZT29_9FLAO|nr:PH domain-containing protein [Psychroflexus salis]GGE12546.1 hypothetical protein GCM10010831_12450 [Psychroflexus salis]